MKKSTCLCGAALVLLLLLSSCFAGNTITDYARNHVYQLGDVIRFYDERNDRKPLGVLTFAAVHVLSDEAFTVREQDGKDDQGKPVYKDVTYNQLVQIDYTYEAFTKKKINRFAVYDSAGGKGALAPDTPHSAIPVETGVSSLIAALPAAGNTVRVEVFYSGVFSPNAIVNLAIEGYSLPLERPTGPVVDPQEQLRLEMERLQAQVEEKQQSIQSLGEQMQSLNAQMNKKQNQNTVLIILLSTVSSVFLMFLWQQFRNRKKS